MRQIINTIVILSFLYPAVVRGECSDAVSNGDDAYTYARKAYRETSFDDAQNYARKAKNASDDAKSAADDCNCDNAVSEFDDAYTYAKRAYNASDLSELRNYARRAIATVNKYSNYHWFVLYCRHENYRCPQAQSADSVRTPQASCPS